MPNGFAYLMLFAWPLVALVLFRTLPIHKALIWTILGGYLILPSSTGVKLPMIPAIDKNSVPAVSAMIFCLLYAPRPARPPTGPRGPERMVIISLLLFLIIAPFLTVLKNGEPVIIGQVFLPGLRLYDAFSMISGAMISIVPFLLAWRYLNTPEAHREILRVFTFGGLAYSLPVIFEARMSPQLHTWFYGFFQHDFIQHIRAGGFRPIVFLSHGLLVGIFMCLSILSGIVLWRAARREKRNATGWGLAVLWLIVALFISKNAGALVIMVLLGSVATLAGQRAQVLTAVAVAVVVLLYPMLRGAGLIPVDTVYEVARSFSEERASSLKFRLDNEDELLARANEKPLSGWGGWGRNGIYDPETGRELSVTDGIWIILIGQYGWLGYIAYFGLLTVPILLYARRPGWFGPSLITPGLLIVLSAALLDFLPNAGLVPYVWMMAGALTGLVLRPARQTTAQPGAAETPRGNVSAREPPTWLMRSAEPASLQQEPMQHRRRR